MALSTVAVGLLAFLAMPLGVCGSLARSPAVALSPAINQGNAGGWEISRTSLFTTVRPLAPFGIDALQFSAREHAARERRSALEHSAREHSAREQPGPVSSAAVLAANPATVLVSAAKPATVLNASKLAWLHVPKAGTSFANVLVTWACPKLPADAVVDESYSNKWGMFVPGFLQAHRGECAHGLTLAGSGHIPIATGSSNDWEAHKGQFVAMFRQPEQRILSGFNHDKHDITDKSLDLPGYARAIAGCSVRMLTGRYCGDKVQVKDAMVDTAIARLEQGFAFVGLTEEWGLSVCLFHKMFGGRCQSREFQDVRPGKVHTSRYDIAGLKGFTDRQDGRLYRRAGQLFHANLERYNVSTASCRDTCPGFTA